MTESESTKQLIAEMAKAGVLEVLDPPRRSWSSVLSMFCLGLAFLLRAPYGMKLVTFLEKLGIDADLAVVPLLILTIVLAISATTNTKKRGRITGIITGGAAFWCITTIFS